MNIYRENVYLGGWFSFNATKEDWISFYAKTMYQSFFDDNLILKFFDSIETNEELLITKNIDFSFLKDKKVLAIGAGPSTRDLDEKTLNKYDCLFSCNHFYKNKLLSNKKIDLVLLGDEISLSDKDLNSYLEKHQPIVGFEHSSRRKMSELLSFRQRYDKCFIYITRYFSRLGYVPRAMILAKINNAFLIDCVGVDGFTNQSSHSFEKDKKPPSFNDSEKFKEQMRIFGDYLLKDLNTKPENFNNIGEHSQDNIYKGIFSDCKKRWNNEKS